MVIVGARGHAAELVDILQDTAEIQPLYFFDDITPNMPDKLFGIYPLLRTTEALVSHLANDPTFVLGVGGTVLRYEMASRLTNLGGNIISAKSSLARIGKYEVKLGEGLNIMHRVFISNSVTIGNGTLLNADAALHHNVVVGDYCEIAPGARLLGHAQVGNFTQVGAGAIVLPHVRVGNHAVIGAGAVVTRNVADGAVVVGVPARRLH